jgi:hypothetical protein
MENGASASGRTSGAGRILKFSNVKTEEPEIQPQTIKVCI